MSKNPMFNNNRSLPSPRADAPRRNSDASPPPVLLTGVTERDAQLAVCEPALEGQARARSETLGLGPG